MFLNSEEICNSFTLVKGKKLPLICNMVKDDTRKDSTGKPVVSFGLNQNSYDIRLSGFKMEEPSYQIENNKEFLSPKRCKNNKQKTTIHLPHEDSSGKYFIIPPSTLLLGYSIESFNIPDNITGFLYCKSTYARLGMCMTPTVLKSGWSGELVLEIFNKSNKPLHVYANEGIGTVYFSKHNQVDFHYKKNSYSGSYMNQKGLTQANLV